MIRGFLTVVASIALFLSLLVVGISWDLSSSLSYSHIQDNAVNIAFEFLNLQPDMPQINSSIGYLKELCKVNSDIPLNFQGYAFNVSCSGIENKSSAEILNDTLKNFIGSVYSSKYDCSYWNCFSQSPMFLVSQKSYDYWNNIFRSFAGISILLSAALFFLVRKKQNLPLVIGPTVVISALPLLAIRKIPSLLPKAFSEISNIFLSQSGIIFIRMAAIGGAIIFIGLVLKLYEAESWLYKFFSELSEKIKNLKKPATSEKTGKKSRK